jgi:hypothetical protein
VGSLQQMAEGKVAIGDGSEAYALDAAIRDFGAQSAGNPALREMLFRAQVAFDRAMTAAGKHLRAGQLDKDGKPTPQNVSTRLWNAILKPSPGARKLIESEDPVIRGRGIEQADREYREVVKELQDQGVLIPVAGESAADGSVNFVETGGGAQDAAAPVGGRGRPGQEIPTAGTPSEAPNAIPPSEAAPSPRLEFNKEVLSDRQLAASVLRRVSTNRADWGDVGSEIIRNN